MVSNEDGDELLPDEPTSRTPPLPHLRTDEALLYAHTILHMNL